MTTSGPPREFPPAPEPEYAMPMWIFWAYIGLLVALTFWVALT